MQLGKTPHPEELKAIGNCDGWTYITHWLDAKNATIVNITAPPKAPFGLSVLFELIASFFTVLRAGQPQPFVAEGTFEDSPQMFLSKQSIAVEMDNAFLVRGDRVPLVHSTCEVYATVEASTNVNFNLLLI